MSGEAVAQGGRRDRPSGGGSSSQADEPRSNRYVRMRREYTSSPGGSEAGMEVAPARLLTHDPSQCSAFQKLLAGGRPKSSLDSSVDGAPKQLLTSTRDDLGQLATLADKGTVAQTHLTVPPTRYEDG